MLRMKTLLFSLVLLLAVAGCAETEGTDDDLNQTDKFDDAQIYAAAISQIYNVDHSFGLPGGSPGWPLVYVVSTTLDSNTSEAPKTSSQELSEDLQKAISAELAGEPFELIWIEAVDDAPIDPENGQIADGEGIIINLGGLESQDDDSVQLSFFMTCGSLCGIGKTYVLNQINNAWQVTSSVGPEIMS